MGSKFMGATARGDLLEQWRSTLFIVAGGLLAINTVLWGIEVGMNTDVQLAKSFFGPAGMMVAFLGMLGMYPGLAPRTPWLARAAALFTGLGVIATGVRLLVAGSQLVGVLQTRPAWVDPFQLPLLIGIVLGFLTFGVAVVRTDVYSRTVGLLLMVPAILFPAVLVTIVVTAGDLPYVIHVLHNGTDAVVLLTVGYAIRFHDAPSDRPDPAPDTPTR